jgi:hypothetical protein
MDEPLLREAEQQPPSLKIGHNDAGWGHIAAKSQLRSVVHAGKRKGGKDFSQSNQSFDFDMYESYVSADFDATISA